jgi:hypothetical protein
MILRSSIPAGVASPVRTLASAVLFVACSGLLLLPSGARADAEWEAISRGRALGYGASLIAPILLGDVREREGRTIAYLDPGGGIEGRVGYELGGGIMLGAIAGVSVNASENSRPLSTYRLAAEARWTLDIGSIVAPSFGLAAGVLLVQLDEGLVPTGYARALLGAQILLSVWAALELAIAIDGALPADGFAEPFAWIEPHVGITFYE